MVTRSSTTPYAGWNERAGRYVDLSTGRFIARQVVQEALQATLDRVAANVAAVSQQLRAGEVTLAQWQLAMAEQVKLAHLTSAALAHGGWAQMTPADNGRVGQAVRAQYQYLQSFAAQVADGTQPLDGTFTRRAQMYANSGRQTFEATQRAELVQRGATEERNVRHALDSCPGCLAATDAGWVPVGTLSLPGARECRTNCRCSLELR